jgi:hypothetical protein
MIRLAPRPLVYLSRLAIAVAIVSLLLSQAYFGLILDRVVFLALLAAGLASFPIVRLSWNRLAAASDDQLAALTSGTIPWSEVESVYIDGAKVMALASRRRIRGTLRAGDARRLEPIVRERVGPERKPGSGAAKQ